MPAAMVAWALAALVGMAWTVVRYGVGLDSLGILAAWSILTALAVKFRSRAWVIVGCALALRLGMLAITDGSNMDRADPLGYEMLALGLLNGDGLVWHIPNLYDMRAGYPPLYAVLLAGAYAVAGQAGPFLLNTLIDFGAAFAGYALVKRHADERSARLAAIALLVWPSAIFQSVMPNKEGLLVLTVVLFAWGWLEVRPVLLGVAAALACLTQPSVAPFLAIAGALWLIQRRWRASIVAVAVAAVVMLPWWIRNWIVLGGFVPLTTASGLNLYSIVAGSFASTPEIDALPEIERSTALTKAGFALIAQSPVAFAAQQIKAIFVSFAVDQAGIEILEHMQRPPLVRPYALAPVLQWPFSIFIAWSAWVAVRARANAVHTLMLCAMAQLAIFQIWFQFGPRHRVHLAALCILATAIAMKSLSEKAKASSPR